MMQLARFTLPLFFLAACQLQTVEKPVTAARPAALVMREIALVANAEDATVSLFDVAARKVVATIDINPDKVVVQRPGTPNYAQDTDISPDGPQRPIKADAAVDQLINNVLSPLLRVDQ